MIESSLRDTNCTMQGLPVNLHRPKTLFGYTGVKAEMINEVAHQALKCLVATVILTSFSYIIIGSIAVTSLVALSGIIMTIGLSYIAKTNRAGFKHPLTCKLQDRDIIRVPKELEGDVPQMDQEPEDLFKYDPEKTDQFMKFCKNDEYTHNVFLKLFAKVEVLSLKELKLGIKNSVSKFNEIIGDHLYAIATVPKKSSHWVAKYAVKFMSHLPSNHFYHSMDTLTKGFRLGNDDINSLGVQNLVVCDDVCYSGKQLKCIIKSVVEQVRCSKKQYNLFCIYHFMSQQSIERIKSGVKLPPNLKVTLITTEHKMETVKDVLGFHPYEEDGRAGIFTDDLDSTKSLPLVATEWKIPDAASFPSIMTRFYSDQDKGAPFNFNGLGDKNKPNEAVSLFNPNYAEEPVYKKDL